MRWMRGGAMAWGLAGAALLAGAWTSPARAQAAATLEERFAAGCAETLSLAAAGRTAEKMAMGCNSAMPPSSKRNSTSACTGYKAVNTRGKARPVKACSNCAPAASVCQPAAGCGSTRQSSFMYTRRRKDTASARSLLT